MTEPLGYIVLIREHNRWTDTWDGEVHPTIADGERSLAKARRNGWEAVLTAAVAVDKMPEGTAA